MYLRFYLTSQAFLDSLTLLVNWRQRAILSDTRKVPQKLEKEISLSDFKKGQDFERSKLEFKMFENLLNMIINLAVWYNGVPQ
jgi:hypothetical protein